MNGRSSVNLQRSNVQGSSETVTKLSFVDKVAADRERSRDEGVRASVEVEQATSYDWLLGTVESPVRWS